MATGLNANNMDIIAKLVQRDASLSISYGPKQ